jgi:hypothetical protein
MVVCGGGNKRGRMGNKRGGMGNNCWCVMVNSQSSCLGNRDVHGNGRGSVHSGVASDPMAEDMAHSVVDMAHSVVDMAHSVVDMAHSVVDMAHSVVDMAHSVGDNSRRCMHSRMPDPMRENRSNGNSRGN